MLEERNYCVRYGNKTHQIALESTWMSNCVEIQNAAAVHASFHSLIVKQAHILVICGIIFSRAVTSNRLLPFSRTDRSPYPRLTLPSLPPLPPLLLQREQLHPRQEQQQHLRLHHHRHLMERTPVSSGLRRSAVRLLVTGL